MMASAIKSQLFLTNKMKKIHLIFSIFIFFACYNPEFKSYYPAYPPMDIKLILINGGSYNGDYLLLFRSGNLYNSRFGGFLIFADATETGVLQMDTQADALYTLGKAATSPVDTTDISLYNPATGIDAQLAILFTNGSANSGNIINVNANNYTLTKVLPHDAAILIPGHYLTMRSYLWDSVKNIILEVSDPGNSALIQ
jgi:hypothetical protein